MTLEKESPQEADKSQAIDLGIYQTLVQELVAERGTGDQYTIDDAWHEGADLIVVIFVEHEGIGQVSDNEAGFDRPTNFWIDESWDRFEYIRCQQDSQGKLTVEWSADSFEDPSERRDRIRAEEEEARAWEEFAREQYGEDHAQHD